MPGARKYIEVLIFVVVWMAAGWIFHLDVNAYLLLGVPLVVLFQLFVARRPLRNLWVRDATAFRLGLIGIVLAALLILAPGYDLFFVALPKKSWVVTSWFLCAMAGAVFAAFALSRQRRKRGSSSFAKFRSSIAHWHRHHGDHRHSYTSLNRLPASEAGFLGQTVLALLYGVFRAGGGCFSRC